MRVFVCACVCMCECKGLLVIRVPQKKKTEKNQL